MFLATFLATFFTSFLNKFLGIFKALTKTDYLLRETFLGIRRGGWMNWAAVSTVAVLLFLFGASLQVSWQLDNILGQMGSQLEISVYLVEGTSPAEMEPRLRLVDGVAEVNLVSKEQAWESLLQDLGQIELGEATRQLGGNPLVDEFKVSAISSDRVPEIADRISGLKGVDEVWYTNEVVERLAQLRQGVSSMSVVAVATLTMVTVAVITTTIRLIILARRREIEIMQLVGATSTWIYFPFLLQGVAFGIVGAAIAYLMLSVMLSFVGGIAVNQPELIQSLTAGLLNDYRVKFLLPIVLIGFGVFVGVLGSSLAVRRLSEDTAYGYAD
ncbi:cell division protein FtsX [Thalassoporum mexicanum PCC 7367]|uniref:cell division protein FtsX n=1 Tax=Thalassoporum mexicanum TaxID=3457544 RepID=UPI00029F9FBC|nr:permease-like cell division protein FtsX [Pseudanabaena sp. PCC 7367]AFY70124.1 cell division protein FtsX [Pseudanabaena sp. PCC 7367]